MNLKLWVSAHSRFKIAAKFPESQIASNGKLAPPIRSSNQTICLQEAANQKIGLKKQN